MEAIDIHEELRKLRLSLADENRVLHGHKEEKSVISRDRDAVAEAARIALYNLDVAKNAKQHEIDETVAKMEGIENDIKRLTKLQAELIKKQQEMEQINALRQRLNEIAEGFDAWHKAHPYQLEDILVTVQAYILGQNGMLNANDMGLGKTYEAIVSLYLMKALFEQEHERKPRILWLTKKSLAVKSTPNEIKRWWPEAKVASLDGSKNATDREFFVEFTHASGAILVTNYEAVRTTPLIGELDWDFVVIDEVHKLKGGANLSGPTKIWVAIKELAQKASFVQMLSGTPMVNKVTEMWSYLHIFRPEVFPSLREFERSFTFMKGMDIVVDSDKLLNMALKGQVISRRRDEVGIELPEVFEFDRMLTMNTEQEKVYNQMRDRFFLWLDEQEGRMLTATAIIAQLTRLRQINVWPAGIKIKNADESVSVLDVQDSSKIDEAMDIIEELNDINEQVVIFSNFNEPMFEIYRRSMALGISAEIINGDTGTGDAEINFQQGKTRVLLINLAMGEGLNLQKNPDVWPGGASTAVFLDRWWNPSRNDQAGSRIHRQGANQPVTLITLVNENSVDQFMRALENEKAAQFGKIMNDDALRPSRDWKDYLQEML